ncbi:hypothetical protein AMAG_07018 [Allomyces macrogynus ATCC 38327]|uniref:Uncharacterized protein n=1 Tax=Allomyces macrogynus (strain ATCC 38327) TaxID=578462 RepID=A0A0L0SFK3_ALLM3|nr:hypothetical protein AMAG_07018 [Allomyces macrogynus ATCC 38327]|eukprot:KNE61276.1 hypothetical protein AMAG_07018 [Allomyces macrogynus ATCC 38327]
MTKRAALRHLLVAVLLSAALLVLLPSTATANPLVNAPDVSSAGAMTDPQRSDPRAMRYLKDMTIGSAFQISFACDSTDQAFCAKAEGAVQRAAQRIASEFKFRRIVTASLSMFLPCGTTTPDIKTCPDYATLGFALSTSRIPVIHKDDGLTYLYPSPLLKQLDLPGVAEGQVPWPQYDILSQFNALKPWWFASDSKEMPKEQRDLEMVVTHELFHGLGFGDDLAMSVLLTSKAGDMLFPYYDSYAPDLVLPPLRTADTMPHNGEVFYQFTAPSVWNRFTFLDNRPLLEYSKVFNDSFNGLVKSNSPILKPAQTNGTKSVGYTIDSVFAALEKDEKVLTLMKAMHTLGTTANKLEFRIDAWPPGSSLNVKIVLETGFDPLMDGSSIVHTAMAANTTVEFLMVADQAQRSFPGAIAATKAPSSGIGPLTKQVMLAMGYTAADAKDFTSRKDVAMVDPRVLSLSQGTAKAASSSAAVHDVRGPVVMTAIVAVLLAVTAAWF